MIFDAPGVEAVAAFCAGIVLETGDEIRAATLLAAGAPIVLVGEAALRDSGVVKRLIVAHGGERVGAYAPARRQAVSWSLETDSNADFKIVAPSTCEPAWEVLTAAGAGSGTLLHWWLAALHDLGATQFLVRADIGDDADLNICARLVESFDERLWLGPLADATPRLEEWITYGQCRQLALMPDLFARMDANETEGNTSCAP
ncbi:MAG: hypothetical protein JSU95_14045 [Betaproteobacteria bacterium]|nr:MAG: hypothetical protein JSU95_14045 [Betaproteobacteria bacterium]